MNHYPNITTAIDAVGRQLIRTGKPLLTQRWQGISTEQDPKLTLFEALHVNFITQMPHTMEELAGAVRPSWPWAEDHFLERVGGKPLNPGDEYYNWPYYRMDEKVRVEDGKFSHTYMERLWPKFANRVKEPRMGIRYELGDLDDLIQLLVREPDTRQAYLPIWFPEDTGNSHNGRVPCTLGYLFMVRGGLLDITYYMRSCDYLRHFRDDVYHAIRMAQYVLEECRKLQPYFQQVNLGYLNMNIANLHIFQNEVLLLSKKLNRDGCKLSQQ